MAARSEMVEKVAQALWPEGWKIGPIFNSAERFFMRDKARIQAPAAIAAVLDNLLPTPSMIEAWQAECAGDADEAGPEKIRAAWAAVIDTVRREVLGHE